jgi:hypothetical protein
MTRFYPAQCNGRTRNAGFIRMLAFLIMASLGLATQASAQVTRTFTGGGSFIVPSGVTSIKVETWGGGAGGGATAGRDGGGGGGAYASSTLTVVPGASYNITIGTGGSEGVGGTNTIFGSNVVVAAGGSSNTANDNGGAGGTVAASIGDVRFAGGNGGNAAPGGGGGGTDRAGGGGGASGRPTATGSNGSVGTNSTGGTGGTGFSVGPLIISGAGGNGANDGVTDNAQNGFVPGGGGGGDGDGVFSGPGSGARGEVRVTYNCPTATISYTGTPFCLSITSVNPTLVGAAGGTYSSTAGLTINGTTGVINPSTSTPGTYTITYAIAASGTSPYACAAVSATTSVTINANVVAGTVSGTSPLCIGGTATYTSTGTAGGAWSSSDGAVASVNASSGLVTALTAGTANIVYTVGTGCGSPQSAFKTVTVNPNVSAGTVTGPASLCLGASGSFSSNGTAGGSWTSSDGAVASVNTTTGAVTLFTAGSTNIVYTVNSGCGSPVTAQATLAVNALPTGVLSGSGTYCSGSSTTTALSIAVTGAGPWSGTLSDGTAFSGSSSPISVNVTPVSTTTYTIATLTDANCTATSKTGSSTVTVIPTPTVNDPTDQLLCNGSNSSPVTFTGSAAAKYSWTNNNTSVGLGANGTGNIPAFLAGNTSTVSQNIATVIVTPRDTVNGVACAGTPESFTITVKQQSFGTISGASNTQICAGQGASVNVNVSTGTPFSGMLNIAAETSPGVFGTPVPFGPFNIITPGASAIAVTPAALPNAGSGTLKYRISWLSLTDANTCGATPLTGFVDITVNPLPVISASAAPVGAVCPGTNVNFAVSETNTVGGTFDWEARDANNNLLASANNVAYATGVNTNLAALGTCPAAVANPVTFTFTPVGPITLNCHGSSITRQVNVMDTTKPTWTTVAANLNRTVSCSDAASLTAAQALFPVASDNCDNDVTNIVKSAGAFAAGGTCAQAGTYTNTWTVTDNCGNISNSYTQVINVVDTAAPTWTTVAASLNRTVSCSDVAGLATAQALHPVAADNCDGDVSDIVKSAGAFVASGTCAQAGTYTNTWTSTDNCGNISGVFTQVINIVDTTKPTWTTVAASLNRTVSCSDAAGLVTAQALFPVASDNCDGDVSDIVKLAGAFAAGGTCSQGGTYTNTWTVIDNCGNTSAVFTQVINIVDTLKPTWVTVAGSLDRTVSCSNAAGLTAAQALLPVATDNCDANVTNIVKVAGAFVAGSCPQAGTYTNTWTVADDCGNMSAMYTQVIHIIDTTAPVWSTVAGNLDRTVACKTGTAFAAAEALFPVATDNCDGDVTDIVKVSGLFVPGAGCAEEGTYTNTWTVTDNCTNVSTVYTQVITVENEDFVMPANAASTVACVANAVAPVLPNVTDNCGNVLVPAAPVVSPAPACEGMMTYTYAYTDCEGNTHNWVYTYTIDDNIKPVLVPPATQYLNVGAGANCIVSMPDYRAMVTATDNCNGSVTKVQLAPNDPGSSVIGYGGTRTVKIVGTDCAGNSDTTSFTLVLVDSTAPTASTQPVTVYLDASGNASITAAMINSGSHDNCSPVTLSASPTTFNCSNVGSGNTVTLTVKDAWMNTSTATATITVVDTVKPVITTCAPSITVGKGPLCTNELLNYSSLVVATDACGIDTVTQFPLPGTIIAALVPVVPITLTVKDHNGNITTCTFNITYVDTTAPVITGCPANIVVGNAPGMCSNTVSWTPPTASDNCTDIGPVVLTSDHTPGTVFPKGTTTVTYTAKDAANNISTCSFTVTVNDTEAPVLSNCPSDVAVNTGLNAASCSTTATWTEPTATDNCIAAANLIWTKSHTPGSVFPVGTTAVTYTATDSSSNVSLICTFNVVVTDNTVPVFSSCPADINSNTNMAGCKASVSTPNASITDNCSVSSLSWTMSGATNGASLLTGINNLGTHVFEVGTTMVTYTATDASGNTATCSYNVIVTNNLQGGIAGTSTVAQNTNTTSNITFIANGGTAPYTFTYTVNGGSVQNIATTGVNTIVTVPQSNAVIGDFVYNLVSITDANGCTGTLQADHSDTIKVVLVVPAADLIPNLVVNTPVFTPVNNSRPYALDVYNIGTVPTSGAITIYIVKPTAAFSLSVNELSTWTVTDFGAYYEVTGSPVIGVNGNTSLTGNITTSPNVSNGNSTISVIVNPGSGGETNSSNNSVNAVLNVTN